MGIKLTQSQSHKDNTRAATRQRFGKEVAAQVRYPTRKLPRVTLRQDESGDYQVLFDSGRSMPATDVEVSLWLRLQEVLAGNVEIAAPYPDKTQKKAGGKRKVAESGHSSSGGGG